jgi:hypothetical protein
MTSLLFIMLLSLLAVPVSAEMVSGPISYDYLSTGYWGATFSHWGPDFLGYLPDGPIQEFAQTSQVDGGSISLLETTGLEIPIPQYADGTPATEEEIFFFLSVTNFGSMDQDGQFILSWAGGPTVSVTNVSCHPDASVSVLVQSFALRQGSVGAAPLDFGQLKALFK